ncbi:MAG: hypothetical protein ACK4NF_01665 [Planctomycetota bacterium]
MILKKIHSLDKYSIVILLSTVIFMNVGCKKNSYEGKIKNAKASQVLKFVLYPVIAENQEFATNLLHVLKEVIEYRFSHEVILQNFIPDETTQIQNDLESFNAIAGLLCKIDSLNLFFPQKIYFRCYVFKKEKHSVAVDISKILTRVKEEDINIKEVKTYKFFNISIDLNSKENLDEAVNILQRHKKEKVFLVEHLFLKQDNFLFVIKEKFAEISKIYLFE